MSAATFSDTAAGIVRALTTAKPAKPATFEVIAPAGEVIGSIKPNKGGYELLLGTRRSQHASDDDAYAAAVRAWNGAWGEMYRFRKSQVAEALAIAPVLRPLWEEVRAAGIEVAREERRNVLQRDSLESARRRLNAAEAAFEAAERQIAEAA